MTPYVALAEETAIGAADCDVVAGIYEARGAIEEALAWVERGLALAVNERYSSAADNLKKRQRALLPRLGRADEAIAAAWADFERRPGTGSYRTLMELIPEDGRAAWHDKAMAVADHGELAAAIEIFAMTGEIDRLAVRIAAATDEQLERMSHYTTERAAELLAETHPALAARAFRAMGLRIVNAKKSKYYDAAVGNFARARLLRGGRAAG